MLPLVFLMLFCLFLLKLVEVWINGLTRKKNRQERKRYYNQEYLKSDAWQRKRYVVFKRDGGKCVFCGARATQVHHKRYARRNIGKEPIEWLSSVCASCHSKQHS